MANKPLPKYATRLLVKMYLTDTHRFSSETIYLPDKFLMTEEGNNLMTEADDYLMLDLGD